MLFVIVGYSIMCTDISMIESDAHESDVPISFQLADRLRRELSNQGGPAYDSAESRVIGGMFVYIWPTIEAEIRDVVIVECVTELDPFSCACGRRLRALSNRVATDSTRDK